MRNRLDHETSPYLLGHSANPVHWQPWDEEALAGARERGTPILLSVGYSACHWCHVMAQESFEDPETAALMNQLFVNIKVDREERPDIDSLYQNALAGLGEQRGWPLTMFLTPDGQPYGGGTYFPPEPGYGRPAFRDMLQRMATAYAETPEEVGRTAARLIDALKDEARGAPGDAITTALLNHVAGQTLDGVDRVYGGFGQNAKFPFPMALELLWRAYLRVGHGPYRDAVMLTLEQMCLGGIYDHLGGGFCRYTVDDAWSVPHFEKMLYDNALLVDFLTLVWKGGRQPLFADRIEATIGFMLREMAVDGGAFASSLAADSEGHGNVPAGEGSFYLWEESEIDELLGAEAHVFKDVYDVTTGGNWEGWNILRRDRPPSPDAREKEDALAQMRERLRLAREARPRPQRDGKVLADWNGLAIAALAHAGRVFGREDWLDAAARAFVFVEGNLQRDGCLHHCIRDGRLSDTSLLDDHAQMARAALSLFETTAETGYLERAEAWAAVADERFWDRDNGGYFLGTGEYAAEAIPRVKSARETAVPSGNGTMVGVLARLHALTGREAYRERAAATVEAFSADISVHFFALATLINNSELLSGLVNVVVAGEPGAADSKALLRTAHETALPNILAIAVPPDTGLPASHPAAGKGRIDGKAAAYICMGNTCQLPVTEAAALRESLESENLAAG